MTAASGRGPDDENSAFGLHKPCFQGCPRQDSNLRTRLRRPMLYPLSYEGGMTHSDATGTCRAPCLRAQRCGMNAANPLRITSASASGSGRRSLTSTSTNPYDIAAI